MALTEKLTNIANAIREKGGTNDALTLDGMVEAIAAIETGSGGGYYIPEEVFLLTGDVSYYFSSTRKSGWLLEYHLDKLSTKDITNASYMFNGYNNEELTEIPFDFNFKEGENANVSNMFVKANHIKKIGKFNNFKTNNMYNLFNSCYMLKELPEMDNLDLSGVNQSTNTQGGIFQNCYSLRMIPESLIKQIYNNTSTSYYTHLSNMFAGCYALDEIKGVNIYDRLYTSNMFATTFSSLYRVKEIQFATNDDGTPLVRQMKSQTINLSSNSIGYGATASYLLNYNSGITEDTLIHNQETYELYKNHPDSWTNNQFYSRYNHDSAVNTINTLPDTSAYLATAGGTNTITFRGNAGSATDGGAINTLTEEEIAVATAKGWTVSFV